MDQVLQLEGDWTIDVRDSVFIQYRGVDVVAVWLPVETDRTPDLVSVTIPSVERVAEAAGEEFGIVEFGVFDETDIDLHAHIVAIDRAKEVPGA